MFFEPPGAQPEPPLGDAPLVLVAPSTHADVGLRLINIALAAFAGEPVRVLASINERGREWGWPVPPNAVVADWVSYDWALERASMVVCHGGHGTVARAITAGVPTLVCPVWGDQADNGARVAWAGAGLAIPRRLQGPRALRLAARRLLTEPRFAAAARRIAAGHEPGDGPRRAADLVEAFAGDTRPHP
jgi:UDP:flavonoid glycosyltransferase YjiC (YdhE family)